MLKRRRALYYSCASPCTLPIRIVQADYLVRFTCPPQYRNKRASPAPPISPTSPASWSMACHCIWSWVIEVAAAATTAAARGFSNMAKRLGRGRPLEYRRILLQLCLARCVSLAELRVKIAPHKGQVHLLLAPDFSFICLMRLLLDENSRPLHPCSQQRGFSSRSVDISSFVQSRKSNTAIGWVNDAEFWLWDEIKSLVVCWHEAIGARSKLEPLDGPLVVAILSSSNRLINISLLSFSLPYADLPARKMLTIEAGGSTKYNELIYQAGESCRRCCVLKGFFGSSQAKGIVW